MCIYDTGARYTTIPANVIAPELNENDLGDAEQKKLGGFIKGDYIKFYKYSIDNLAVGNIILGPQDVWITFDEKIGATLLGMDIIKQLIAVSEYGNLCIFKSKDELIKHYSDDLTQLGVF